MGAVLGLVFGGVLFGAMLLIVVFAYRSIEEQRAQSENVGVAERALDQPRFFATLQPADSTSQSARVGGDAGYNSFVDSVANALEQHIRRESVATNAFAREPSIERLYRSSGPPILTLLQREGAQDSTGDRPPERAT